MILSDHFISLNTKLTAVFRNISSRYDVSFSQYCIIMKIQSSGTPMSNLAKNLGLDKSTLTRNIDVLIKRDIVEKFKDSKDLRVYKGVLSDIGEKLKFDLYSELDVFTSNFLTSLDKNTQSQINIIDKLVQKLDGQENLFSNFWDIEEFKNLVYISSKQGLISYDKITRDWKLIFRSHSFKQEKINTMVFNENFGFFGTNSGLLKFDFNHYFLDEYSYPFIGNVNTLHLTGDNLWLGTSQGLIKYLWKND